MATIIDYSGRPPSATSIKKAGHVGVIRYFSDSRPGANFAGKPMRKAELDDMKANGLAVVACYQFGKENDADVRGGYAGGVKHAKRAEELIKEAGGDLKAPIFFAVDFNIDLKFWNDVAVHFFRGVASVIGLERTGIYGHSRVCSWAIEDKVIGRNSNGRYWAWQTIAWSNGEREPQAVLYQDTFRKYIEGTEVDVNQVLDSDYGQFWLDRKSPAPAPVQVADIKPNPQHRGDPLFLPKLLKAWGVKVEEFAGWKNRGQGDFDTILGVLVHHTGAYNTTPSIIAYGHSGLRGLLSQIHLSPKGVATIVGAGTAYHAGEGVIPGVGSGYVPIKTARGIQNQTIGNGRLIGIEAQHSGTGPWPKEQYDAYVRTVAAILWYLGLPVSRAIGHKEYATPKGRKVDPNFDMNQFRRDVQVLLDNPPVTREELPKPPAVEEKKPMSDNPLEEVVGSLVDGSTYEAPLKTFILTADKQAYEANENTKILLKKVDALLENQKLQLEALKTLLELLKD